MTVYVVTYVDKRWPKEPIVTVFSNEDAARSMQEHVFNTNKCVDDVAPIFDECDVYDEYKIN